jgi:hypothetical protein
MRISILHKKCLQGSTAGKVKNTQVIGGLKYACM